jgi:hypothetical protein
MYQAEFETYTQSDDESYHITYYPHQKQGMHVDTSPGWDSYPVRPGL